MNQSHKKTNDKYEELRFLSRQKAWETLPSNLKEVVKFQGIDSIALSKAKLWESHLDRVVDWNWTSGYMAYAFRHPKHFELAVYHQSNLCSLTIGRPTWSGTKLRIDFTEAQPGWHPLKGKIIPFVLVAAEAYASAIGANEIRLMEPLNDTLTNYYLSFNGYSSSPSTSRSSHFVYKAIHND